MSRKKKDNSAQSTRQLMGIDGIKDYCIATRMGELVFFIIKPTNISVLPDSSISARIYALLNVVKGQAEIEMLALNSKESFERNKNFYRQRQDQEVLPAIRKLLEQDSKYLDRIQVLMASSREFYMLSAAKNVRNAMLFNVLSFMSDKLLTGGNTVAALDELYIWLSNPTAIEYIRNCLKRVRKKESAMLLASQNLEDFDQEGIREMTKPLFSIPPHQFLFNAGSIDKRSYMEMLQLEESEYNLIKFPQRGVCLYKCGNERYLLEVHAPAYKEKLFGTAGGR